MESTQVLGSWSPMDFVHVSNMKLNADIFSNRSLSIQRRILIKNFLTVLYQLHPIEWIEENPLDDQDQWMEQTLSAAGIGDSDASTQEFEGCLAPEHEPILSPVAAAAASAVTARRRPQSLRSTKVPLPRPVSMELPLALQSYLSTVFDVDWSVGLSNTENSLFTSKPSQSPLRSSMSFLSSSISSSSQTPPTYPTYTSSGTPSEKDVDSQFNEAGGTHDCYGKSEYEEDNHASPYLHSSQSSDCRNHNGSPKSSFTPGYPISSSGEISNYESYQRPHIHNHIHIHIHNYTPDNVHTSPSSSIKGTVRSYPSPIIRSSRYPKPEPRQSMASAASPCTVADDKHNAWSTPADDLQIRSTGHSRQLLAPRPPVTIAMANPQTSLAPPSLSSSYPPEKSAGFELKLGEEQFYLATTPLGSLQHARSPPPPPYTQSPENVSASESGTFSHTRLMKRIQIPSFLSPILTKPQPTLPSSSAPSSSDAGQKLIEYQQYQERQKMFVSDDNKEERRSTDGLGFIRQLFRQNSKRKGITFISAPLPSSSSSLM
ncbi:hypothetical protein BGZ65_002619 [Modicella reniformis]|uniref:Uncharacterized protein n=1 Tax=Modicella reniformis TaxID=1440133 RepID=A0A9P6M9K9_9FUNG|nr:hypothetical protein BGZ65_002619 [Modicella reniformis]